MRRLLLIPRPARTAITVVLGACAIALFGLDAHRTAVADTPVTTPTTGPGVRLPPVVHRGANLSPPAQSKPVPLVIALHGAGATPAAFQVIGFNQVADKYGFVVAYLDSPQPLWKDPANITYIGSEISQLTSSENIDQSRVYVVGFSLGGYATYRSGCELSRQVAAVAVVSNAMAPLSRKPCHISRPVSELDVAGSADLFPIHSTPSSPISADQTAADWRMLDGCSSQTGTTEVGPVTQTVWSQCNDGATVGEYVVQGGIHTWPGSPGRTGADAQYDATAAIWTFFAAHQAPSATSVSARLISVRAARSGRVTARLLLGETQVTGAMSLSVHGHLIARTTLSAANRGALAVVAAAPRSARAGPFTVVLALRDQYGRTLRISRKVQMPAG